MPQIFTLHPKDPQPRLIRQAAGVLRDGAVIVYPTDSCYALGCLIGDKAAMERIRRIRRLDDRHDFTLICPDLSEVAIYAKVGNAAFRMMRRLTPGPWTFLLRATHEVPRRLQNPRRQTIGIRIPDNAIAQALLGTVGQPLLSTTLTLPGDAGPLTDPEEIAARLNGQVELILDGGPCGSEPTSVIDYSEEVPRVVRQGLGDVSLFEWSH